MTTQNFWRRTLYIAFLVQFMSALGFSSSFPFLSFYIRDLGSALGLSDSLAIGLAFSSQAITMMLAAPLWGILADRRGRKMMVIRASLGGAFFIGLMGFARSAEDMILLRGLQGLVTGVAPALVALVAGSAPREQSGYAMGVLQMGLWSGAALGPVVGGIIADMWGYQATYLLTAALLTSASLVMWAGVSENFEAPNKPQPRAFVQQWRDIWALPGVPLTFGTKALNWMIRNMLNPFTPLLIAALLHRQNQIATLTGLILGAAAFSSTVSSVFLGRLSDRVGHQKMLVSMMILAGCAYIPQYFVTAIWQLAGLQILIGVAIGGILPSVSALMAVYTPAGIEGAVYGLDTSVTAASRAVAPMVGALVVGIFGLRGIFLFSGLLFFIFAGVLMGLPQPTPLSLKHKQIKELQNGI